MLAIEKKNVNEGKLFLNLESNLKKKKLLLVLFCSVFVELQRTYNRHLLETKRRRILRTKFISFYWSHFKLS